MNDLLDKSQTTSQEIAKTGVALNAMNDMCAENPQGTFPGNDHLITQRQIGEIITILKMLEYNYADPAIRALRALPVVEDFMLQDVDNQPLKVDNTQ